MPTRLTLTDPNLLPIQAFFNAVGDASFLRVIECLTKGVGFSINDVDCSFPGDLDPGDESFDGVRFSLFEQRIVISTDELWHYLEIVCKAYIAGSPKDETILGEYLRRKGFSRLDR